MQKITLLRVFLNSVTSILRITLDFFKFFLYYCFYINLKIVKLVQFLTKTKNNFVKKLMWRRGLLFRPLAHSGLVVLSVLALIFGGLFGGSQIKAQDLSNYEAVLVSTTSAETLVPQDRPRAEIVEHIVASGETLSKLAEVYGVSVETIKWANDLSDDSLTVGDTLKIPPVTGMLHTVKSGDNIDSVSKKYKADAQTIIDFPFNYIDDSLTLKIGQVLVIPNGVKPEVPRPAPSPVISPNKGSFAQGPAVKGSGSMRWPLSGGISQYASWWHPGSLDITGPVGTPIAAADNGRVIVSQKLWYGYGWHIVLDHGNGVTSLYGHMSALYVDVGQNVSKGQVIGAVGLTGRTTGPHLHFETRRGGAPINPLSVLQ